MPYHAPMKDMLFVLQELAGLSVVNALPGCEEATRETVEAVLEENAKFCSAVLAPLNWQADQQPGFWQNGQVSTAAGFKEAFKAFAHAGWQGIQHPCDFGGQGLPKLIATPCIEMLNSANLSFALCPLLTDGAIEALMTAGSDAQKATYLPKLVSGQWTGTMNLTESQAGSDLSMVRTRAVAQKDGTNTYKIFGTKIYITYGEHDMAENIVHLVLARSPGAPEGVKGLSLFLVPKFFVELDGSIGARNDVQCLSIEHKLGIKASPTAVLQFGDQGGAIGTLVGEENRGLEYMFIMMNAARFAVGVQGIGIAERAYQQAVDFARTRVQSRGIGGSAEPVAIIDHPDVRRMLMSMRAQVEASRAVAYITAAAADIAHHSQDEHACVASKNFYEFMVPIVKGWSTEMSIDVASLGVQIHGGMGFIEETGAAQYYRDARILTIYEGTTAIQANDLIARKTVRDGGKVAQDIIAQARATQATLANSANADLNIISGALDVGLSAFKEVVDYLVANVKTDARVVFAGSVPYLKLVGIVIGGWQMARAALAAETHLQNGTNDTDFYRAKIVTARFYAEHILVQALAYRQAILFGGASVLSLDKAQF